VYVTSELILKILSVFLGLPHPHVFTYFNKLEVVGLWHLNQKIRSKVHQFPFWHIQCKIPFYSPNSNHSTT